MPIGPGTHIGPYEVTSALGAGGMGEVWRARDPRLGRDVAIKVLPAALANDPERRARFEREGRLLASLAHPKLAGVLGLEDVGGAPALVLELVEGDTLEDHLVRHGAFPVDDALAIARQIAEAVEYAHERGIVHRDLKPANVKRTPDGIVKVLDFGLAKALAADDATGSSPQLTQSPTMSLGTHAGVLLGTAAYMAPEQARGRAVDRRADIWAFGAVVFELLTGRQLFAGETVSDTIARILEREPDWSALPGHTPSRIRELLRRCLVKDARQRLRDIGDARLEIEAALAAPAESSATASAPARRGGLAWQVLTPVLVVAALAGGWLMRGPRRATPPLHVSVAAPDDLVFNTMMFGEGPDRSLYASGSPRATPSRSASAVYRRELGSFEWQKLAGSEGKVSWDLSADGHWLYLLRPVAPGARQINLQRMPTDGSAPPVTLAPWSDDSLGAWEVLPGGRIAALDPAVRRLTVFTPGEGGTYHWRPITCEKPLVMLALQATLPTGDAMVGQAGYYGANGWTESAAVLGLDDARVTLLAEDSGSPRLMPGNRMLMTRGGTLLAAPYDPKTRRLRTQPVAVLQGLRTPLAGVHAEVRTSAAGDVGVLLGGTLALQRSLVVTGSDGRIESWNDERRAFEQPPVVSPDGRLAAVTSLAPGFAAFQILVIERGRSGVRASIATAGEDCSAPAFSPDSRQIAWMRAGRDSTAGVYVSSADGRGPTRRVRAADWPEEYESPAAWFPAGDGLLVLSRRQSRSRITRFDLRGDRVERTDVVNEPFDLARPALSPDGQRIVYVSYETGEPMVVAAALAADGRAGPAVPVSRGEGLRPQWIDGGRRLLWATRTKEVLSAGVSPTLEISPPTHYADLSGLVASAEDWSSLPDGRLLVTRKEDGEGEIRRFDLLLGFSPELERTLQRAGAATR